MELAGRGRETTMMRFLAILAGFALAGVVAVWVFAHLLSLVFYVISRFSR